MCGNFWVAVILRGDFKAHTSTKVSVDFGSISPEFPGWGRTQTVVSDLGTMGR